MFWPVMFEAASNVGPERAPKKCRYCFWKSLFVGHQTAHTASTADSKPSRQQSADHSSMSLMSMLQSYVHVNPRIYFFSIFLSCTSTQKKLHIEGSHRKKNHVRTSALKKKCTWKGVPHRRRQYVRSGQ